MPKTLKIASWNINSVRARLAIVEKFLRDEAPDILCLQETKVVDQDFPRALFHQLGYTHQILCGQRMHHGVAILSKLPMREEVRSLNLASTVNTVVYEAVRQFGGLPAD